MTTELGRAEGKGRPDPGSLGWAYGLPLLLALGTFAPMLGNRFWRDDYGWISRAMDVLSDPGQLVALSKTDFRPLPGLSFVLNYLVSGLNPAGYYAFNLLVHLANTALVVALAHRLSGRDARAATIAGMLFACGTFNHGEAVIWIAGRTGLIADFFVLATLLLQARALESGRARDLALVAAGFVLALFSKESAVVLLPLLAALEWALGRRAPLPAAVLRYGVLSALLVSYLGFQFVVFRRDSGVIGSDYALGLHGAHNMLDYLVRLFLPVTESSLIVAVPAALEDALHLARLVLMAAVPIALLWVLVRPSPRPLKLAALWIPLTLLPYVFLTFPTITRYLYLPSVGVAIAVALLVSGQGGRPHRRATLVGLATVIALEIAVVEVVITARRREQLAQSDEPYRELAEKAARLGRR